MPQMVDNTPEIEAQQGVPNTNNRTEFSPSIATVETHTMGASLWEYLRIKVHPDILSRDWSKIIIRGRHSSYYPSRIMPIEKSDKLFNWQRPTTLIKGDSLEIQCFPGNDYIYHYARIVATYLSLHEKVSDIVRFVLPSRAESLETLINSNLRNIGVHDVAILGYVQGLHQFVTDQWEGGNTSENDIFGWQLHTLANECRIAFIGCKVSFWGDIAGNVVRALQSLHRVKCVLYIGKLGSLRQNDIPNTCLATGNTSLVYDRMIRWDNVLQPALEAKGYRQRLNKSAPHGVVRYGAHITLSSVLQETKGWVFEQQARFDWVDPEIGHMAVASLEGNTRFGYLHIVSDNLMKQYIHDLSNEREHEVLENRQRVVDTIQEILAEFFNQCGSGRYYDLTKQGNSS